MKISKNLTDHHLELYLLDAEARRESTESIFSRLVSAGIPDELAARLIRWSGVFKRIGRRVIAIGRIVLQKLADFTARFPHLCAGLGIGAVIGWLLSHIPVVGQLLSLPLVVGSALVGGAVGIGVDLHREHDSLLLLAIEAARRCFQLLIEIIGMVFRSAQTPSRSSAIV